MSNNELPEKHLKEQEVLKVDPIPRYFTPKNQGVIDKWGRILVQPYSLKMIKKDPPEKIDYPPIPEDFVFPDGLDDIPKVIDTGIVANPNNPVYIEYVKGEMLKTLKKYEEEDLAQNPNRLFDYRHLFSNDKDIEKYKPDGELIEKSEAEWIKQVRDFCKQEQILPTTLISIYKEHKTINPGE